MIYCWVSTIALSLSHSLSCSPPLLIMVSCCVSALSHTISFSQIIMVYCWVIIIALSLSFPLFLSPSLNMVYCCVGALSLTLYLSLNLLWFIVVLAVLSLTLSPIVALVLSLVACHPI